MKARLKSSTEQNEGQNCNISFSSGFTYLDTGASTSHAVTNLAVTGDKPFTYSAKNKLTNKENSVCSGAATCLPHPQPAQWLLDSAAPAPPWPGRCAPPGEGACGWRNRREAFRCFEDWMQSKVEGRQGKRKEN